MTHKRRWWWAPWKDGQAMRYCLWWLGIVMIYLSTLGATQDGMMRAAAWMLFLAALYGNPNARR